MASAQGTQPRQPRRFLVLCVDRDDDLGFKTGIRGPVLGKEANIQAAMRLALADPAEADANAIFYAVKVMEEIKEEIPGVEVEVATITGDHKSDLLAGTEVMRQLEQVVGDFKPDHIVLVSDGADDERILPILTGFVRNVSARRIVVQQHPELEDTYFLLKRYIAKLLESPSARVYALGIPGSLILLSAVLSLLRLERYLAVGIASVLGIFLMEKGFSLRAKISSLVSYFGRSVGVLSFLLGLGGLGLATLQVYQVAVSESAVKPAMLVVAEALRAGSLYVFVSLEVMFLGAAAEAYISRKSDYRERLIGVSTVFSGWLAVHFVALYLEGSVGLVTLVLGLAAAFAFAASSLIFFLRLRSTRTGSTPGGEAQPTVAIPLTS